MAADVNHVVPNSTSYARNDPTYCHKRSTQLFPAGEPVVYNEINIIRPSSKAIQGNAHIFNIMKLYLKSTGVVPSARTPLTHMANIFLDLWLTSYGKAPNIITDNKKLLVKTLFAAAGALGRVENTNFTTYHSHINGKVEHFKKNSYTHSAIHRGIPIGLLHLQSAVSLNPQHTSTSLV